MNMRSWTLGGNDDDFTTTKARRRSSHDVGPDSMMWWARRALNGSSSWHTPNRRDFGGPLKAFGRRHFSSWRLDQAGIKELLCNLKVKGAGFARWQSCAAGNDKCIER